MYNTIPHTLCFLLRRSIKSVPLTLANKLWREKLLNEKSANETIAFAKAK